MPRVTLVSDIEPSANGPLFQQLVNLSHLLVQSGHDVSLWLTPQAREQDLWPKKSEKLSPCPNWSAWEAVRALPFWLSRRMDVLHFIPRMDSQKRSHAFSGLIPLLKGVSNPLIVSSFYSWPPRPGFHIQQLLHLSEVVLTPSENLRHLISADPNSTSFQHFAKLPLFPLSDLGFDEFSPPSHYLKLKPFIYLPGPWRDWEDPEEAFKRSMARFKAENLWFIGGSDWTQNEAVARKLQNVLQRSSRKLFFPEKVTPQLHRWLLQNAQAVEARGLRLNSLSLSLCFEECLEWEIPLLFSKFQSELHSQIWTELQSDALSTPEERQKFRIKLTQLKSRHLKTDPGSLINRFYSQGLARKTD